MSPQRSFSRTEFDDRGRLAVGDAIVQQHPHRRGRSAVDDKLHAAVAEDRAVRQRIAELQVRLLEFCGCSSA